MKEHLAREETEDEGKQELGGNAAAALEMEHQNGGGTRV